MGGKFARGERGAAYYARDGHIGVITLNRPDNRNSMTPDLLDAFARAVGRAARDRNARCVVIVGKGNCFSAGADFHSVTQRKGRGTTLPHQRSFAMYEPFLSVLDIAVPVVGALNGHAVGGGFGLSLMCDIRIANVDAKYGANFTKLGLSPGMAISYLLPRLVGLERASEMLYTGRLVKGAEAERIGLVSRAVAGDEVLPAAMELAAAIAASAPFAVAATKSAIRHGLDWRAQRAAAREAVYQAETIDTADAAEGIAALLEKRAPEFRGK